MENKDGCLEGKAWRIKGWQGLEEGQEERRCLRNGKVGIEAGEGEGGQKARQRQEERGP